VCVFRPTAVPVFPPPPLQKVQGAGVRRRPEPCGPVVLYVCAFYLPCEFFPRSRGLTVLSRVRDGSSSFWLFTALEPLFWHFWHAVQKPFCFLVVLGHPSASKYGVFTEFPVAIVLFFPTPGRTSRWRMPPPPPPSCTPHGSQFLFATGFPKTGSTSFPINRLLLLFSPPGAAASVASPPMVESCLGTGQGSR